MKNYDPPLPEPQTKTIEDIPIQMYIVENEAWLLDDRQVAAVYGITPDCVRRHRNRNKDKLIDGIHWFKKKKNKPPRAPHFTLWTKEGFIKLGNFVKTKEAESILSALKVRSRQQTKIESEYTSIAKENKRNVRWDDYLKNNGVI